MSPLVRVTAEDLLAWADRPDARHELPRLLRRLLAATGVRVAMGSGSQVDQPGYDGVVRASAGTQFCPQGASVWELSTSAGVKSKLDRDWHKRSKSPGLASPQDVSIVFVTARHFAKKIEWAQAHEADRIFRSVRVLDADDLEEWLGQAPAVAAWFASEHLDRPSYEFVPIDEALRQWSQQTQTYLPSDIVLEGREAEQEALISRVHDALHGSGSPTPLRVRAQTVEEARVFILATLARADDDSALASRVAVVRSSRAWHWATAQPSPHRWLLVPDFERADGPTPDVGNARALIPAAFGPANDPMSIQLREPLPWRSIELRLQRLGRPEHEARSIARDTAGDLPALRRALGLHRPGQQAGVSDDLKIALVLLGAWAPQTADRELVEALGVSADDLEGMCARPTALEGPVIERDFEVYRWRSHSDAWELMCASISESMFARFEDVATTVLGEDDPALDLPRDERFSAPMLDVTRKYSSALRGGISKTLCLLAWRCPLQRRRVERIVDKVLAPPWRRWASLADLLPELAEAAPATFLRAMAASRDDDAGVHQIAHEQADPSVAGPSMGHVVAALEVLAWDERYFSETAQLLARLAAPHGLESLRGVHGPAFTALAALFGGFAPQTKAPQNMRQQVLREVVERHSEVGWELLLHGLRGLQGGGIRSSRRPIGPMLEGVPLGFSAEIDPPDARVRLLVELTFEVAGTHARRWADLITVGVEDHLDERLTSAMKKHLVDAMTQPGLDPEGLIWDAIGGRVGLIHTRDWAERKRAALALLEPLRSDDYAPTDPVVRYASRFRPHPNLKAAHTLQDEALHEILDGEQGIARLASLTTRLGDGTFGLGQALARSEHAARFETLLFDSAPSSDLEPLVCRFANGLLARGDRDREWLFQRVRGLVEQGRESTAIDCIRAIRGDPELWDFVETLGESARARYWKSDLFGTIDLDDRAVVARSMGRLLEYGNVVTAGEIAAYVPTQLAQTDLLDVLDAVLNDRDRPSVDRYAGGRGWVVERLWKDLDRRDREAAGFDKDTLARLTQLEVVSALQFHHTGRSPRHLNRYLQVPEEFVRLVGMIYAPDSDANDNDNASNQARNAYHLLSRWEDSPGSTDPARGEVILQRWAERVLLLASNEGFGEHAQGLVAEVLARPGQAEDGHWPCIAARVLLKSRKYSKLEQGLHTAKRNARGLTTRYADEGGEQEYRLAAQFEASAVVVRQRWPATARLLDGLARSYHEQGREEDESARSRRVRDGRPRRPVAGNRAGRAQDTPMEKTPLDSDALPPKTSRARLGAIEIEHAGPVRGRIDLGSRVTLLTGDNGLGKTHILDVLWWAMTGQWAGHPLWVDRTNGGPDAKIRAFALDNTFAVSESDRVHRAWSRPRASQAGETHGWPVTDGPVVYARLDGAFTVWDPKRNDERTPSYSLDDAVLWDKGLVSAGGDVLCQGIVSDLERWSLREHQNLAAVMSALGKLWEPVDGVPIVGNKLGTSRRLSKGDVREVPTLPLAYGDVPITLLSGGMRRVLALAYVLVWTWSEHKREANEQGVAPADRLVLLVDEVEAHLHPRWQRTILPGILAATQQLAQGGLDVQVVTTTHSPLVAASLEPLFDSARDRLLHLDAEGETVKIRELPWAMHTEVGAWLTAPPFGLRQPTSVEAERVILAANAWMRGDREALDAPLDTVESIDAELRRVVGEMHPIWARWRYYGRGTGS